MALVVCALIFMAGTLSVEDKWSGMSLGTVLYCMKCNVFDRVYLFLDGCSRSCLLQIYQGAIPPLCAFLCMVCYVSNNNKISGQIVKPSSNHSVKEVIETGSYATTFKSCAFVRGQAISNTDDCISSFT